MSLQARMNQQDPRYYNVNRDVAHNFGEVMKILAERMEAGGWDTVQALATGNGLTDEELGKACQSLCNFVEGHMEYKESMSAGLGRSGFLSVHPMARLIVMAWLGNITLGMHWAGVREATIGGSGPAMTYKDLAARGAECAKLMTMGRWQRRWFTVKHRVRRVLQALRGGG